MSRVGLLAALIVMLAAAPIAPALHSAAPVYAQNGAPGTVIPLPVAEAGEHPRLLITRPYVQDTLQPRAAAHTTTWNAFEAYVSGTGPEDDAEWTPGTALRSLALAWLITNDGSYAARAKSVLNGLATRVRNHPVMSGAGGFDGEFMGDVSALAVGYDWLYGALTASDRAALRDTLWQASAALRDPANDSDGVIWVGGQLVAFGNYEPRWLWALTAVGLALDGEYEGTAGLIAYCRKTLAGTFIPALDLQEGGAWAEGPVYGFIANWPKVQTALAWWTALGENYVR